MLGTILGLFLSCPVGMAETIEEITVDPPRVRLQGPGAVYSLLVHGRTNQGQLLDRTPAARFRAVRPAVARVSADGVIRGVADGATEVIVEVDGQTRRVAVTVTGTEEPRRFNFENDIIPLLSRYGCNASGCHGKAEGQNGFKLSVFGFDPAADYEALVMEARGRRVMPVAPDYSLLLTKMSGRVAHGGGTRIPRASEEYHTIRAWIAAGMPFGEVDDPKVVSIRVEPRERQLAMRTEQQLRVIARYSDNREVDVTAHAKYQTNNDALATVSETGRITAGDVPGDVAVMASFMGQVDVFRAIIPRAAPAADSPMPNANNFIDPLVFGKLRKLNITPSAPASDAEYLRRVYLDVIGTLPTAAETRRFLSDTRPDRRTKLVDDLLQRPEFADYWALKWADLLRVDRQTLGHKRAYAFYRWIRQSIADNKPLDQFARELLLAEGPLDDNGPANFYRVVSNPGDMGSTVAQVFLGVRIACAECHHHPFDRWSQTDFYGMQAFFAPVRVQKLGATEAVIVSGDPPTKHPRSGATIFAHALGQPMPEAELSGDRRRVLADWLTAADNPWFARNVANRAWAHFLGRGLVDPVDDVRATNPPSNPELLDALAQHVINNKYDFRQLIRAITAAQVYQLSSTPNATNERDEQNYSRALFKRIDAEVLLDMVCQTTGVPEKFDGLPAGYRAIQLWDSKVPHYFLKLFGRPTRTTACECERIHEPGVSQVLHLLNAEEIHAKLNHEGGAIARLVKNHPNDAELVEELYLTFYSRFPADRERDIAVTFLRAQSAHRRQAAEDLAWTLMNTLEFGFNH
ncbi:MAG: DUF1549 domain-containing protein [Gemmataceae bacterium]